MTHVVRLLGSLRMAVPLLLAIAGVLAWGTFYEARFGTAAVQQAVYRAWWFQGLLAFLALNLAVAALERFPWQRRHVPFVLAHIGIILMLIGGVLGGRFGIEGQLIIPEGQARRSLELPQNVLVISQPNPGLPHVVPIACEARAWVHEPHLALPVRLEHRAVRLTIDRYYPDAVFDEEITDGGPEENPALHLLLDDHEQQDAVWLFSRDPERFVVGWGEAHVLFLEPASEEELARLISPRSAHEAARGIVSLTLPGMAQARQIPVPEELNRPLAVSGTSYQITFKDYFPDFAITERGPVSRSTQPNNPAVAFTLTGPEGHDAYLLFALHPEFQAMHGVSHSIAAKALYTHAASGRLPPNSLVFLRRHFAKRTAFNNDGGVVPINRPVALDPPETLLAIFTGEGADQRVIDPVALKTPYPHPSLGWRARVAAYYPNARIAQRVTNRSNDVHLEALHLLAQEGRVLAETWVSLRNTAILSLGPEPITVEYRPAQRELPVSIKLLDFRKTTYPGTQTPSGFESDVELSDPARGLILMRTIRMNQPLRYRGFSFFQSSYVEGPTQTTVLSVRNDPGTPFVYAGFLIVLGGVVSLFLFGSPSTPGRAADHMASSRRSRRSRRT